MLVAIGIGVHNFGEGLAIGTSFAFGQLTLGSFLIVGFMIHNITEGLGIAAPAAGAKRRPRWPGRGPRADRRRARDSRRLARWLRRQRRARGALLRRRRRRGAFEVVAEVARYVSRRDPAGLRSSYALGGFLAGIAIMYATGLLAA